MSEAFKTFRDLECWQACRAVRLFVAKEMIPALPHDEKYRFGDQILRASRSGTSNIAEGYGRYHYLDNAKFCSNARGSLYEVLDHLITAHDEGLISERFMERGEELVQRAVRLMNGYIRYLRGAAKSQVVQESADGYHVKVAPGVDTSVPLE